MGMSCCQTFLLYMTVIFPALQLTTITSSMSVSAAIITLPCNVMVCWYLMEDVMVISFNAGTSHCHKKDRSLQAK